MKREKQRKHYRCAYLTLAWCLSASAVFAQNPGAGTPPTPAPQAPAAGAATSTDELRKASQNPVSTLINVPIQNTSSFDTGTYDRTQNTVKIQPVIPVRLSTNWNLIMRIIQPLTWQPDDKAPTGTTFGLGDMNPTFFFSPEYPGKLIWGAGPVFVFPTATDAVLGKGKLSIGPSAVVLFQPAPWNFGLLFNNYWSVAGSPNREGVNQMLLQYLFDYNFKHGWYLASSPEITANWMAASGQQWVVPLGGGGGRVLHLGTQAAKISAQAFGNVVHPRGSSPWSLRVQFALLYPKKPGSN